MISQLIRHTHNINETTMGLTISILEIISPIKDRLPLDKSFKLGTAFVVR